MKHLWALVLAALSLAFAGCAAPSASGPPLRPSVVFLLGAEDAPAWGCVRSSKADTLVCADLRTLAMPAEDEGKAQGFGPDRKL